jgi:CMD domain protein
MTDTIDVIDHLVGITPGAPADALRSRRPITKEHAQKSWTALFEPVDESQASLVERFAVAVFVAVLHGDKSIKEFYGTKLAGLENGTVILATVTALAELNAAKGPYGHYPEGPLSAENTDGPALDIGPTYRAILGDRLSAALEHAYLLTYHPRDASPAELQKLLSAGWSTTGVVTLSQLVSFLAFQIRVVAGLRVLAAA